MNGNKLAAGGSSGGALGLLITYAAGRFGAHLTSEDGAAIAVTCMTVGAVIVHYGIVGIVRILVHGEPTPPQPSVLVPPSV